MDEVMAIENGLDNIFIESPSKDTGSVLRSAFLDKNLIKISTIFITKLLSKTHRIRLHLSA
jgi:hypothetical protein